MRKLLSLITVLLAFTLVAAACGDDSDDEAGDEADESTESGSDPDAVHHSEMSAEELEVWQTDLQIVGCYAGAIDGDLGPETEAAIKAFQDFSELTTDGLLGPITEQALTDAVETGGVVCDPGDEGAGVATVELSSASYSKVFDFSDCSLNADVSNVSIRGERDGITLAIDAVEGAGTLAVDGGTEADGITLNGEVVAVEITDRNFVVSGEFGEPNLAAEEFSLVGTCPE